ncbi:MAG: diaminopimelate decarboxylase, partial [Candidatus Neomarinimicrobiota bacterium]
EELARTYGTPLYIYSKDRLAANLNRLDQALAVNFKKYHICYAVKANSNPNLLRIMKEILPSLGGDCSSPGEMYAAELAGIDLKDCIYTGNYESCEDLLLAVQKNCRLNLDDITSLDRLIEFPDSREISFRLNPGFGKGTFSQIVTAGKEAKFGIPEFKINEAYARAKKAGFNKFGIQCMAGSGVLDESYFPELLKAIITAARNIEKELDIHFSFLSIGGGFGIPYEDLQTPLDLNRVFKKLSQEFYSNYTMEDPDTPSLWIEPGKILVGDAGILLTRVNGVKKSYKQYIGLDGGMETFMRPALYGAYQRLYKIGALDSEAVGKFDFTGPICENTDRLAVNRAFPQVYEGDLIALMDAGAYGYAMSHNFNGRPRPAEVLVENSTHSLLRNRETIQDLYKNCNV